MFKVRGLLDLLIPKFESEYHIHQECTIDEAMIPFKGRLAFKQYMKAKPTKWGIKVFVLAGATNGYIRTFQIYTGKSLEDGNSSVGLCSKVVLDLMSGLEGSGLHLYTDNYYTSPSLYLHLYNRGINACGTARPNRIGFPKELLTKATNTNRGFVDFLSNGPLLATIWVDKRSIYFLSTIHVAEPPLGSTCTVKRHTTTGAQEDKPCPPCLPDYQCFMRGVDRNDQMQQYYNLGRCSIKWWKRIFYYLVESTILNSFIMESHVRAAEHTHVSTRRDYLTFRLVLASELIGTFTSRKRLGRPRSDEHAERTRLKHNLDHYPRTVAQTKRCVVCEGTRRRKQLPERGNRHESRTLCSTCQSTSALMTSVGVLKNITRMWITAPEYLSPALLERNIFSFVK